MATVDQPTPPNLGNLTPGQFLALDDWSVAAQNQTGPDGEPLPDTWTAMQFCVVALLYRLIRDNFAYENDAWACRVSTPLLEKILSLETQLQSRPTDNLGQALTIALLGSFATQAPSLLFNCDGDVTDPVTGTALLVNVDSPATPHPVYQVVNAQGSQGPTGTVVYGLRTTLNRWYYTDAYEAEFALNALHVSCNVVPQWPQDSSAGSKTVLLKVADHLTTDETGASKRMQFEFGLQDAGTGFDAAAHGTDRVLYLRYYDANDVEQKATALVGGEAVGIGYGREITVGFARILVGNDFDVSFYVNGVLINTVTPLAVPSAGNDTGIRLHVGAGQLGEGAAGGPINNVYYLASGTSISQAASDTLMNSVYRIGAGYLTV